MPRATEHIAEIIEITQGLIDKGFAYASAGDVYFDVTKAPEYGKLSHRDPEELQAGARIEPSALKRHPGDFALWKASKPGEPSWESPWGPGRPGWHIECSAMSMKLLGPHFDIHGGGLDLVFPHHENELVQSESYTGQTFATYWLHNGLLTKEGRKISKSDPGHDRPDERPAQGARPRHAPGPAPDQPLPPADRLRPVAARRDRARSAGVLQGLRAVRAAHRRELPRARRARPAGRLRRRRTSPLLEEIAEHRQRFLDAMDDDFNTGGALGELYEIVHALNRFANGLTAGSSALIDEYRAGMIVLRELTRILGLFRQPVARAADAEGPADRAAARPAGAAPHAGPQGEELQAGRRDPQHAGGPGRHPRGHARRHHMADRGRVNFTTEHTSEKGEEEKRRFHHRAHRDHREKDRGKEKIGKINFITRFDS